MRILKQIAFCIAVLVLSFSCKPNRLKVDISDQKQDIKIVRFDQELLAIDTINLAQTVSEISNRYPAFFDLFTYKVIQIGGIGDSLFVDRIKLYLTDTLIIDIKKQVDDKFSDFSKTENEINEAFKHYQYYFKNKPLPTIYTCISGFNQSVFTAENIVGVSLDKYLGRDCAYYQKLHSTPQYKILNMYPAKITSDVMYAWAVTEFEHTNKATTLLDNMIHQGKLMYFVDAMLPEMHDSLKIGYTALQLKWCKKNEAKMWTELIGNKMLYSNKRMDIIRYVNQAPTTSGFPLDSPGRTGVWIGWQIVREYMAKFPKTTLSELMLNSDYQQILNQSKYYPE